MTSLDEPSNFRDAYIRSLVHEAVGEHALISAIHQLVITLEQFPFLWRQGDGYGGYVKQVIEAQITSIGLPWEEPRREPVVNVRRLGILERDDYTCQNCGVYDEHCHVDHIIPRSRGGGDDPDNLQALCARCNSSKGSSTMDEWEATGRAQARREAR